VEREGERRNWDHQGLVDTPVQGPNVPNPGNTLMVRRISVSFLSLIVKTIFYEESLQEEHNDRLLYK